MKQTNNIKEEWKVVKEFPIYSISNLGRLRNDVTKNILVGGYDKDGYRQATICYNGKQYSRRLCRLVAIAFLPNPNNLSVVNHKDENKDNDFVDNLEWCDVAYNNSYGNRTQQTRKRVICVETRQIYDGLRVAEKLCNISHSSISQSCRLGTKAGGYHWKYIN